MEINSKLWASCEFTFSQEPLFVQRLLRLDIEKSTNPSMIFLDRAFIRGPVFFYKTLIQNKKKAKLAYYPNWYREVLFSLTKKLSHILKYPNTKKPVKPENKV